MDFCLIADAREVADANALIESIRLHHPGATVHLLALDARSASSIAADLTLSLADLAADDTLLAVAATHPDHRDGVLLGPLLAHVFASGRTDRVIALGAHTLLISPVTELIEALGEHDVVVVPVDPDPAPREASESWARVVAASGVLSRRVIGARPGPTLDRLLAEWPRWAEPEHDDIPRLVAADAVQRHLDRAAATLDGVWTLVHGGYAYGAAAAASRLPVAGPDGSVNVDGAPLRVLDLTDFAADRPHLLAPGRGHLKVSEAPELGRILAAHAARLLELGWAEAVASAPPHTRDAHQRPLDALRRGLVREAHADGDVTSTPLEEPGAAAFGQWLAAPATKGAVVGLTRLHQRLWEDRLDLRAAYPHLDGPDAIGYAGWLCAYGPAQVSLTPAELPPEPEPQSASDREFDDLPWGVNVAGFFRSELGLGEAARLLVNGLDAAAVPALPVQGQLIPPCRQEAEFTFSSPADAPYPINIVCMNGDTIPVFAREAGPQFFEGRHTIALWWWELTDAFPDDWHAALEYVDEIWVATQFIYDAIAPHVSVPVLRVPLSVTAPRIVAKDLTEFGIRADDFVFLFLYDYHSTAPRKNPVGHIEAFKQAFAPGSGAKLVLKSINAANMPDQHEAVMLAIGGHPDIVVIDRYMSLDDKNALVDAADCLLSLHRSEGFGLTPAEAMALGKPVIATRYAGVLEFMTDENSYLIGHDWTRVGPGAHPYPADAVWAEPDIGEAVAAMRHVFEHPDEARARGAIAARDIAQNHSPAASGAVMRARLQTIYDWITASGRHAPRVGDLPTIEAGDLAARIAADPPVPQGGAKAAKDPLRKAVGRALGPWTARQRRIDQDLLRSISSVSDLLASAGTEFEARRRGDVAQTLAALRRVRGDLTDHRRWLTDLDGRLTRVEHQIALQQSLPYITQGREFDAWADDALGDVIGFRAPDPASEEDSYRAFEDTFRGDAERVRALQREYVPLLVGHGPVLDCGCGRGELLDLLREAGMQDATGVDLDAGMLAIARRAGLDVTEGDAITHLESLAQGSLGAVVALEVIEHLPEPALRAFFRAALRALRPGGRLLVETVNPHAAHALKAFWLDPTHQHPLFGEVVLDICRGTGFATGRLFHPGGTGDVTVDRYTEPIYAVLAEAP